MIPEAVPPWICGLGAFSVKVPAAGSNSQVWPETRVDEGRLVAAVQVDLAVGGL